MDKAIKSLLVPQNHNSNMLKIRTVREWLPIGILPLDLALGGGFPLGHYVHIVGDEKVGKTELILQLIKAAYNESPDNVVYLLENETTLYKDRVEKVGIDWNRLSPYISQERVLEKTFAYIETCLGNVLKAREKDYIGKVVIIVDTLTANATENILKNDYSKSHHAKPAQVIKEQFVRCNQLVSASQTLVVFVNQISINIGAVFGSGRTPAAGGKSLTFFSSAKLDLVKSQKHRVKIKNRIGIAYEQEVGFKTTITLDDIKTGGLSRSKVSFDCYYKTGMDIYSPIFYALKDGSYLKGKGEGGYFDYRGKKIQRTKVKEFMEKNPELAKEIKLDLKEFYSL